MSTNTANYNLVKPDVSDFYDISVPNGNMDVIDLELKAVEDTKVSKSGDTMTGNLNVPTINSKTPAYAESPTETVITTGFPVNITGNLTYFKTQENVFNMYGFLQSSVDFGGGIATTVYTLPIGHRPKANIYTPISIRSAGDGELSTANGYVRVLTTGEIQIYLIGTLTGARRINFSGITYVPA